MCLLEDGAGRNKDSASALTTVSLLLLPLFERLTSPHTKKKRILFVDFHNSPNPGLKSVSLFRLPKKNSGSGSAVVIPVRSNHNQLL